MNLLLCVLWSRVPTLTIAMKFVFSAFVFFLKTVHLITLLRQFFLGHPVPCSDIDVAVSEELLLTATQHNHRFAAIIQVNLR